MYLGAPQRGGKCVKKGKEGAVLEPEETWLTQGRRGPLSSSPLKVCVEKGVDSSTGVPSSPGRGSQPFTLRFTREYALVLDFTVFTRSLIVLMTKTGRK